MGADSHPQVELDSRVSVASVVSPRGGGGLPHPTTTTTTPTPQTAPPAPGLLPAQAAR